MTAGQSTELITVIIPVFDRPEKLKSALASLFVQQFPAGHSPELEVLIIDDGSQTPVAPSADPRVRVIRHQRNLGAAAARNTGLAEAQGSFIAFLDSDDSWQPHKLWRQLKRLKAAPPDVAGVFSPFIHQAAPARQFNRHIHPAGNASRGDWFDYFLKGCRVAPGSSLLMRREAVAAIGPQDEQLRRYEDWDWLLSACREFRFSGIEGDGGADDDETSSEDCAVLGASERPLPGVVNNSLVALAAVWMPQLTRRQRRLLRATIAVERAAAYGWQGNRPRQAWHLLRAGLSSPDALVHNLRWRYGEG